MAQQLGSNYQLDSLIGRGGMGEVWRGRDRQGRPLAFKLMLPELAEDEGLVARFLRERSILTRLDSPYVVQVYDMVAEGGRLAIVMPLVESADLRAALSRSKTVPPADAFRVVAMVLRGVEAAHQLGIVHRDLKPGNVLLAQDQAGMPLPKVTDFGIASLAEGATRLTTSSAVIGTPVYMAPEQADHGHVGPAADIYAAGVMLYEMLSGVPPFVGRPMVVLRGHVEREPGRIPGLPDDVWNILTWMLAKNPAERFPTALAAAEALEQLAPRLAGLPPLPPLDAPPTSYPSPVPPSATVVGTTLSGPRPVVDPGQTVPGYNASASSGASSGDRQHRSKPSRAPLWAALAVGLVLLGAVAALLLSSRGDDEPTALDSQAPTAQPSDSASGDSSETPSPSPSASTTRRPSNSPSTGLGPTVDPAEAAVVRHEGPVTLRYGNSIDLDSRADNWDQNSVAGAASPDLTFQGTSIATESYSDTLVPVAPGSPVAYQTCAAATGYVHRIEAGSIDDRVSFCALTDGNRYSYVAITNAVPDESGGYESVVLNITTFELEVRPTPGA